MISIRGDLFTLVQVGSGPQRAPVPRIVELKGGCDRQVSDSVVEDETYGFARYSKLVQLLA